VRNAEAQNILQQSACQCPLIQEDPVPCPEALQRLSGRVSFELSKVPLIGGAYKYKYK
jgi:hypothetical protein